VNKRRCFPIVIDRGYTRRVSDGARTRDLRYSPNPNSQVRGRSLRFRYSLIEAVISNRSFAGVRRRSPGLSSKLSSNPIEALDVSTNQ